MLQCGLIWLWPVGLKDIISVAQFSPQMVGDVRCDGAEQTEYNADAFMQYGATGFSITQFIKGVDYLHAGGDHGIELLAIVIEGGLLQCPMDFASCRLL